MITYQDSLKSQIKKLQDKLDELKDLKIGNLEIGGGVI